MKKERYKISKNFIITRGKENTNLSNEFIVFKRSEKVNELAHWKIVKVFDTYEEAEEYIRGLM